MSGGNATSTKKDNMACRLGSSIGASTNLATEIAKITNAIREALMGCPPPAIAEKNTEKAAPLPGFLGDMISRSEDNNRTLNYVLDELRTVLGEIS